MDDYQTYIQSGSDNQSTGGGRNKYSGGGGGSGCGPFIWIIVIATILMILGKSCGYS